MSEVLPSAEVELVLFAEERLEGCEVRLWSALEGRADPFPKDSLALEDPSLKRFSPPSPLPFTAMSLSLTQVIPSLRYAMISR